MQYSEVWQFLAGLGFFLYGMSQLERILKNISGRRLKLFLKKNTKSLFKAILGGTIVTGIVQSSSVVSLIVLAFVEAGIIHFRNALAVILGANLGTTLDSWLVAFVGFKLNILNFSFPIIACSAIGMFFLERRKNIYNLCSVLFALGLLFLGLDFMKHGALVMVKDFDMTVYAGYDPWFFVLIGFMLTTIIQSSSATIAIALTAIYVGALQLPAAAVVVIGSEVGTTIKILLWGMVGSSDKRRVAWGNFIYNIFTSCIAFFGLNLFLRLIVDIMGVQDPLIGLVFFQSSINVVSILLFVPFLSSFSNWLERTFQDHHEAKRGGVSHTIPLLAVDFMKEEAERIFLAARQFNQKVLCREQEVEGSLVESIRFFAEETGNLNGYYDNLKNMEGGCLEFYAKTLESNFNAEDSHLLLQYAQAIRQSLYGVKAIKDIAHNLLELDNSINNSFYQQRQRVEQEWRVFDKELEQFFSDKNDVNESIYNVEEKIKTARLDFDQRAMEIIQQLKLGQLGKIEASTLMNVYREIFSSKKSLLRANALLHGVLSEEVVV